MPTAAGGSDLSQLTPCDLIPARIRDPGTVEQKSERIEKSVYLTSVRPVYWCQRKFERIATRLSL